MALRLNSLIALVRHARSRSSYGLLILMVVYLVNQMDRFVLGIASKQIGRDLHFAQFACFPNTSSPPPDNASCVGACTSFKNESECTVSNWVQCQWDYTATGIEYEILAGPAFTLIFTIAAIPLGVLAGYHRVNRKIAITVCLVLWSTMTLLAGFTLTFWQLLLTRIGLGIFEAVCTPFASSIISDYFDESFRGTALGFYNWGIYIGYSLAFAFNFILLALDWRWTFRIASFPGFVISILLLVTVREPERRREELRWQHTRGTPLLKKVLFTYLQPSLLLLCVAGGVRQAGGLVWAYNAKAYFEQYYCGRVNVGEYLSWVPLVGGTLGAVLGGYVSDWLTRSRGSNARLWVLIVSQLLAAPFLVGVLFLPPNPWAFLSLLPAYIVGEMWIGACLAVVISLVPPDTTSAGVALFLFIINNIGGTMNLLISPMEAAIGLRYSLLILFPGQYVLAAALFAATFFVLRFRACQHRHMRARRRSSLRVREGSPLIQNADMEDSFSESDSDIVNIEGDGLEASFVFITTKGEGYKHLQEEEKDLKLDEELTQKMTESYESEI